MKHLIIENRKTKNNTVPALLKHFDQVICIAGAMIEGQGEDSYFCVINEKLIAGGVFDGCGGSGARKYEKFGGYTGAYLGSRIISGITYDYMNSKATKTRAALWGKQLKEYYNTTLLKYKKAGGKGRGIKGSMVKDFPSTAAFTVSQMKEGVLKTTYYWAGDSRGYFLTKKGLSMVTKDDVSGEDAMSNLTNDGVLTNVISASSDFVLHEKYIDYDEPCVVITATDGCFNYLPSPMYFEYLILESLHLSKNMEEWKKILDREIRQMSSDDYTLNAFSFGYGNFQTLKADYEQRLYYLKEKYIEPWDNLTEQEHLKLWEEYQKEVNIFHG